MASIGNPPRPQREILADRALIEACIERVGFVFRGIEPAKNGGVIAIVVNGNKTIMHLGRDRAEATFSLAALMRRPLGRGER